MGRIESPLERILLPFQWGIIAFVLAAELMLRPATALPVFVLALAHPLLYALILRHRYSPVALSLTDGIVAAGIYYLTGNLNGEAHVLAYGVIGLAAIRFSRSLALVIMVMTGIVFHIIPTIMNAITPTIADVGNTWILYLATAFIPNYFAQVERRERRQRLAKERTLEDNLRLQEQTHRLLAEQQLLADLSREITADADLDHILHAVLTQVRTLIRFRGGSIFLVDEDNQSQLYLAAAEPPVPNMTAQRLPIGQGLAGRIAARAESLLLSDVKADGGIQPVPDEIAPQANIRSYLGVPLLVQRLVIGVLQIDSDEPNGFGPQDRTLLEAIARQVSGAVELARLYEQARGQLRDLSAVRETLLDITAQLDLPQVLRAIAERAADLVSAKGSAIYLLDAGRNELEVVVSHNPHIDRDYTGQRLAVGEGLAGRVAASGQPLVVDDYQHWEGRAVVYTGEPFTAVAGVPLAWRGQVIGVLDVLDDIEQRAFTQDDVRRLMLLAPQAAIAIVNARAYHTTHQLSSQLQAVNQAALALTEELSLDRVMQRVADIARDLAGARYSALALFNNAGVIQEFVPSGLTPAERQALDRPPCGGGLLGDIYRAGRPIRLRDLTQDPRSVGFPPGHPRMTSFLGVPILAKGQAIGQLYLTNKIGAEEFNAEDQQVIELLAAHAALAIQNARLYAQVQQRLIQINTLQRVSQAISSSLNLHDIFHQIVEQLQTSFGYPHIGLYLLEGDELRCEAYVGFDPAHGFMRLPLNVGVIGRVARTGQAALVRDVGQDPDFIRTLDSITMEIAVPLLKDERILGILNVESGPERPLTQEDLDLLTGFAQQASIAVDNAQLYERAQDQLRELNAVRETLLDITAKLGLPQVLRAIAERAADLVSAKGSAIYLLDAGRNELEVVVSHNPHIDRDYTGQRLAVGEGLAGRVAASGQPLVVDDYQHWEGRSSTFADVPFTAVASVPLEWQGQVIGALNVVDDIEQRAFTQDDVRRLMLLAPQAAIAIVNARLYEELRQASEELERKVEARTRELAAANERLREADRLKMQFLANMSHELRTPMNSIIGYSELMLSGAYGDLTARQRDRLNTVIRNARNLLDLINDLLDISRIEVGKVTLARRSINLNRIIETTIQTVEPMARQKGLTIRAIVDETLQPVEADETRLIQILNNLLSNAIKFTSEGGITVTAYPYTADGQWVAVSVSDTGIGIAPEHIPLIFEEFRQIDQSATREFGGTGLGLAIAHRLVALHGGRIWVDSEPGVGSTFTFTLPAQARAAAPALPDEVIQALASKLEPDKHLVLVVDDDPAAHELMSDYLEHRNDPDDRTGERYQVLHASNGEEALALAQNLHPYAIILDVLMDGTDGWEVLKHLKADPTTASIPVIVVSVVDDRPLGFSLGAYDYLLKPVERQQVLASLERCSNGDEGRKANDEEHSSLRQAQGKPLALRRSS